MFLIYDNCMYYRFISFSPRNTYIFLASQKNNSVIYIDLENVYRYFPEQQKYNDSIS